MITSAAMIGIDSCPIEGFHEEKIEKILREQLDVDTNKYGLSYMVAFGHRKDAPPREKSRRPFDDIVTWK
jgi:nitroreductase